jgi:hypothetical protein
MRKFPRWKRSLVVPGAVFASLAVLAVHSGQSRSAEAPEPVQGQAFQYAGSAVCSGCHATTPENPRTPFPYSIGFIKLDESVTWDKEDKHSIAYKRLNSDRGRRMASLLKVDVNKREAGCLNCHSASINEVSNRADQGVQFNPSEGVSCENCHGPYSGWAGEHIQTPFRTKGSADWAKVGFNDLRSPDRQAEKCLSCHIGNSEEGKVVTHEMYAAGHPPLPSIEVATFANSMPRHWWLLAERKNPDLRAKLGHKEGQLEQTKLALVGAAVALKTSMKLLADEAKATKKTDVPGLDWPDYARFDCWSCHHDLKRQSWRQERGYEGPPGRVPVSEWPLALVDLGIERLVLDDPKSVSLRSDLQQFQKALHDQANVRPFGRKAGISKAADDLAGWSDLLVKKLAAATFDREVAAKLLRKLVEKAEQSTPDYDSARHIAWTIKLLVEELAEKLPNREPILAVIKKLDEGLNLNIPAGRKYEIEDQIGGALQVIGDYEPATFQEHLKELLGLLPPG